MLSLSELLLLVAILYVILFGSSSNKTTTIDPKPKPIDWNFCFQKRIHFESDQSSQERSQTMEWLQNYQKICSKSFVESFCDRTQCLPIESCPDGWILVPNQIGYDCCPACIELLGFAQKDKKKQKFIYKEKNFFFSLFFSFSFLSI